MLPERLFRSTLLHADPARRVIAVAKLPPQSDELAVLLATDPAPEVRIAAANCCGNLSVLAAAWENESDPAVRAALSAALRTLLSESSDSAGATALLDAAQCTDAMRADVARRAPDVERRRSAIAAIREEALLVELALTAEDAKTRMAAAQHVRTPDGLRELADAARDKDRGVARLARKRLDAIENREGGAAEADVIVSQLEALASKPGPILTTVIELNRRWQALNLSEDPARLARCEAARQVLQARFDREHAEQRTRMQFEHRLSEWLERADPPATSSELDLLGSEVAALRAEGQNYSDTSAQSRLDEAEQRVERWARELQARAGAEALVVEAEQLAAGTSIDDAKLPERWQALDQSIRAPVLTRRFESALSVIEQRRLAQIQAAEREAHASRQQLHTLLHSAEQSLAAGQLQTARAAAEAIRTHSPGAGLRPKPTLQRLSRLMQQLKELEAWESFGQHQARVQLCERAEAAATLTLDAPHLAVEVQKLRNEWSALDQQHGAAVPKALWERFDRACEKAYAPAARYFAEQAAVQKQVRKQREEFITATAAQARTFLVEPRDWRAIERWLRETDRRWREGDLGSVAPKAWKGLDARLKAVLASARDALSAAQGHAKARRLALIEEATALAAKALERDAPAQVKVIQAQWQAQAKELILPQRDERALWQQFRAACDAVFEAREAKRQQEDVLKREARGALENICVQLEQLALATDKQEQDLRRGLRDLQEQWMRGARTDSALRGLESRFRNAKMAVEAALSARARTRETEVWRTLAAKERLCDELDRRLCSGEGTADAAAALAQWTALTALPATWEKAMVGRRDTALRALADETVAAAHVMRIERGSESRREMLLGLELLLGLESPPELQPQRRALQLKQLQERFQGAATTGANSAGDRLLLWCAEPGVVDARDRQRCERMFSAMEHAR